MGDVDRLNCAWPGSETNRSDPLPLKEFANMNTHRLMKAVVAIVVALVVVSAPVAVIRAFAQPTSGAVFHIGLSKNMRGQFKVAPVKHYACKDQIAKVVRKMWTGPTKFTVQVSGNPGPCDELPQLFGGTMDVAWTVTVRDEPISFGTHEGKF